MVSAMNGPPEYISDEIEITSEMVEVGLHELSFYHPSEDSVEFASEVVSVIFREMLRLRRSLTL
jgi:hypothetical protein